MIGISSYRDDYFRVGDPTEYRFATRVIGSWEKWVTLLEDRDNLELVEKWRKELLVKVRSDSLVRIMEAALGETRDALNANKYLYEADLLNLKEGKVGRPTKESIQVEAKKLAALDKLKEEDFKRLNIV